MLRPFRLAAPRPGFSAAGGPKGSGCGGVGRNKDEDLTGWLTCKDAVKFEKIGSCLTCGKLSLAFNGIGDKEAIALAKGPCPCPPPPETSLALLDYIIGRPYSAEDDNDVNILSDA